VTSDSLAARAAVVVGAERLILLKSVAIASDLDWTKAAALGIVDKHFPVVLRQCPHLRVEYVHFRQP
jgi:hypothetical protein